MSKNFFGDDALFTVQSVSRLVGSREVDRALSRVDAALRLLRRHGIFSLASSLRVSGNEALSGGKIMMCGSW